MGRSGRRSYPAVVASAAVLFALLAASAWLQTQAVRLAYRSRHVRAELEGLERREQTIHRRLGEALSLERLDEWARRRKGLTVPRPEQVRWFPEP